MFIQKYMWAVLAICLAVGLGVYVGKTAQGSAIEGSYSVVKTYSVPVDRVGEIKSILNHLLYEKDKEGKSTAQAFGNGLLVVKAPQNFHDGISQLISKLKTQKSEPNKSVRLDYWLLFAGSEEIGTAKNIKSLAKVIQSINEVDGPQNYRVLEHLSSNSASGRSVEVRGRLAQADSSVNLNKDSINLKLRFNSDFGQVKTSTQVANGEFVILGQSGIEPRRLKRLGLVAKNTELNISNSNAKVYYVIRATTIE